MADILYHYYGVRIGISTNLFNFDLDENGIPLPSNKIMTENDVCISPPYSSQLIPVTYTKDDDLINPTVGKIDKNICNKCGRKTSDLNLQTNYIGRFKREYWSGQSEWRYILIAIPKEYYRNNEREGIATRLIKGSFNHVRQVFIG
ncbi:hypothetical protein SporoP8_15355 [Sporosarcina ureae]|uniref:DUF2971 domain-containing protein n=1 Tax=Sporosarcina ureae TaxID=1571 RepID=UPI000A15A843|nr:DUF2971 domain-containing protein [Sporosarcina ureae]ARJ40141.1 hypothetical protein SporoP8_15355 [Sporosarcina ureae]